MSSSISYVGRKCRALIYVVFLLEFVHDAFGLPTTIGPDEIQRMDGVPVLGRGYSVTTNSLQSSCIDVNHIEMKGSYNFDYYFTDFSNIKKASSNLAGRISNSFGYSRVKDLVADALFTLAKNDAAKANDESIKPMRYSVVVTLRLENMHSSINEDESSITKDAVTMLEDEEYVNFFMSCGPNYIRSIRRAQEVTAIISYEAYDDYTAQEFAEALRLFVFGNRGDSMRDRSRAQVLPMNFTGFNIDVDFDVEEIRKTMSIEILGFGLGLNATVTDTGSVTESDTESDTGLVPGSDTLVATSLDEFNQVMRFAFDSMTKSGEKEESVEKNSAPVGMIYEVEVTPWTDNAQFLKAANVDFNTIMVPIPRSLIENATGGGSSTGKTCLTPNSDPDDFGKCCDSSDMVNVTSVDKSGFISLKTSCQPQHYLSPIILKDNLETNAEFVSWLDFAAREKINSFTRLTQCVNKLRSFPKRFEYYFMKSSKKATYDGVLELAYTLKELRSTLDPFGNMTLLNAVARENEEYFEMFYNPCLSALYGMDIGNDRTTDPKYFMAEPWYNLEQCAQPSCLQNGMAWNRIEDTGCIEGILGRREFDMPIPSPHDPNCAKTIDPKSGQEICKFMPDSNELVPTIDECRRSSDLVDTDGRGKYIHYTLSNLIDNFCLPQLYVEGDQAFGKRMDEADERQSVCSRTQSSHHREEAKEKSMIG